MTVNQKIKEILKIKKISQIEIANIIGMNKDVLNRYLNDDEKKFPINLLLKISKALKIDPCVFIKTDFEKEKKLIINGNYNNVGNGNKIKIQIENDYLHKEIEYLKEQLKDKEEIIKLLKKGNNGN